MNVTISNNRVFVRLCIVTVTLLPAFSLQYLQQKASFHISISLFLNNLFIFVICCVSEVLVSSLLRFIPEQGRFWLIFQDVLKSHLFKKYLTWKQFSFDTPAACLLVSPRCFCVCQLTPLAGSSVEKMPNTSRCQQAHSRLNIPLCECRARVRECRDMPIHAHLNMHRLAHLVSY